MRTVQQTCIYNIKHVHNIMHNAIYNRYCIYIYIHTYIVYIYIYILDALVDGVLVDAHCLLVQSSRGSRSAGRNKL